MKYALPNEIFELDEQIAGLQSKRDQLYATWLNEIAPIKVGDRVSFIKGRITREGEVTSVELRFSDSFDYRVRYQLKKGGFDTAHVYTWDKINKLP